MLFERVQDPKSTVGNLFDEDAGTRSWLCNPHDHSGVLKAELQLEHTTCIRYIDLGNCGSAFIQIDVGRSSWPPDHPYTTLLPTTTLMSPAESRQGTVRTGVRMFKKGDFLSEGAEDSWDRVRVTCSQPFNRRSQFGLSFLRIRSAKGENDCVTTQQKALEGHSPGVGEWLSSPAVQRTFFREKSRKDIPMASVGLSRTARMVLSAASRHPAPKSLSNTPSSPPNTCAPPKTATCTPSTAEENVLTSNIHPHTASKACLISALSPKDNNNLRQPKRKKNSNTRRDQLNESPCKKQREPQSRRSLSPVSTARLPSHLSPAGDIETTCPICGEFFTAEYLPLHASSCQGADAVHPGIVSSLPLSPDPPSSPEEDMFPCPVCSFRFPASRIQLHASTCGELSPFIWLD